MSINPYASKLVNLCDICKKIINKRRYLKHIKKHDANGNDLRIEEANNYALNSKHLHLPFNKQLYNIQVIAPESEQLRERDVIEIDSSDKDVMEIDVPAIRTANKKPQFVEEAYVPEVEETAIQADTFPITEAAQPIGGQNIEHQELFKKLKTFKEAIRAPLCVNLTSSDYVPNSEEKASLELRDLLKDNHVTKNTTEIIFQWVNKYLNESGQENLCLLSPYLTEKVQDRIVPVTKPVTFNECEAGCCIFTDDQTACNNPQCLYNVTRVRQHQQIPLASQLGRFFSFEKNREKIEYKWKRPAPAPSTMESYYDGSSYSMIKSTNAEEEKRTIDLIMYVDGFAPFDKARTTMTMVMFTILNLAPDHRYKQENMFVTCVPTGKKKARDIFKYLVPTLQDVLVMEKQGLTITFEGRTLHYKVRVCMISTDIVGLADLIRHKGFSGYYGCRICVIPGIYLARAMKFNHFQVVEDEAGKVVGPTAGEVAGEDAGEDAGEVAGEGTAGEETAGEETAGEETTGEETASEVAGETTAGQVASDAVVSVSYPVRSSESFMEIDKGIKAASPLTLLDSFARTGASFWGLDEMHLWGANLGKNLWAMICDNKPGNLLYYLPIKLRDALGAAMKNLKNVNHNGATTGEFKNPAGGNSRSVDWIDFLLFIVPTLLVDYLEQNHTLILKSKPTIKKTAEQKEELQMQMSVARDAVRSLSKTCYITQQLSITAQDIQELDKKNAQIWFRFLYDNAGDIAFSMNQHLLTHLGMIIKALGPMRTYSARPLERMIGIIKRDIRSTAKPNDENVFKLICDHHRWSKQQWNCTTDIHTATSNITRQVRFLHKKHSKALMAKVFAEDL
ncbi:hypothetical protein MBANPS3_012217 [Mucor bainieri]